MTQFKNADFDRRVAERIPAQRATDEEQIAAARDDERNRAHLHAACCRPTFRLESNYRAAVAAGLSRHRVFTSYWKYLDIDLARR